MMANDIANNIGRVASPLATDNSDGGQELPALPTRKRLDHRGPLSIDISRHWYFITICAENHAPWIADPVKIGTFIGRAASPLTIDSVSHGSGRAASPLAAAIDVHHMAAGSNGDGQRPAALPLDVVAPLILREAAENHIRRIWFLSLFLVMPDHLHFIVRGSAERSIANFKHLLSRRYGLKFQRDFFDTRLRDDVHFAEKYAYILGNPVRKGLSAEPLQWPYSIAFNRETGEPIKRATKINGGQERRAGAARPTILPVAWKMANSVGQNGVLCNSSDTDCQNTPLSVSEEDNDGGQRLTALPAANATAADTNIIGRAASPLAALPAANATAADTNIIGRAASPLAAIATESEDA